MFDFELEDETNEITKAFPVLDEEGLSIYIYMIIIIII